MVFISIQVILIYRFKNPSGSINYKMGYEISGMIVAIFLLTPGIVLFFTVKEPKKKISSRQRLNLLLGLKITITNFPFVMIIIVRLNVKNKLFFDSFYFR